MKLLLILLTTIGVWTGTLSAAVANTKHNLTISSTGTIKAATETEECVFCHIPHVARPEGSPLWNRSMPVSDYIMYNSDYLKRMSYPTPTSLGNQKNMPGTISRQCLSCHDGTVAVGAVYKLRQDFLNGTSIEMNDVEADGTIKNTSAGYIGTDLSMHHPVGIEYNPDITLNFGNGIRTMELVAIADVDRDPTSKIKLHTYGDGKSYVECTSCHNPHTENAKFLHVGTEGNLGANIVKTCTTCHEKTGWAGSAHQLPPNSPSYTDPAVQTKYGTSKVGDLGCANCHIPHNDKQTNYLTREVQAQTCYQGAASSVSGAACHGTGGVKDIQSVAGRNYKHPIGESGTEGLGKHTNLDVLYGGELVDPNGGLGLAWATNQHATCMDCHNPHQARPGTHVADGSWYGPAGGSTNAVSGVLTGVPGVEPTWPAAWTQPTTFTTQHASTKEYQICLKCHSYWGVGSSADSTTGYVSLSGAMLTDVAWEMNINNKSGHPVIIKQSLRDGSYAPKQLDPSQLLTPWTENPGENTMYCSDCHGSDAEMSGDPKGPHGSDLKYLLKGVNNFWPTKEDGVTLYSMDDIGNSGDTGLFCKNCHNPAYPHTQWSNNMSNRGFKCVECHVVVPHGSPVSRLIGYYNFPEPYNYGGNSLKLDGWVKRAYNINDLGLKSAAYSQNASCTGGGGGGGGGGCHATDNSASFTNGYDANPYP